MVVCIGFGWDGVCFELSVEYLCYEFARLIDANIVFTHQYAGEIALVTEACQCIDFGCRYGTFVDNGIVHKTIGTVHGDVAVYQFLFLQGGEVIDDDTRTKPFIVQSHAMQVRVLGTTFNLKSGENGQRAVATLLKGEVEVKGNHGEGMIVLSPGQQAELDGMTRRLTVKPAEPGIEGWHDTAFDLNQTDIRTLCKILERAYNVKIIIAPDVDIERTYSGPLKKKENVAATLDLIKNSIGIKYFHRISGK